MLSFMLLTHLISSSLPGHIKSYVQVSYPPGQPSALQLLLTKADCKVIRHLRPRAHGRRGWWKLVLLLWFWLGRVCHCLSAKEGNLRGRLGFTYLSRECECEYVMPVRCCSAAKYTQTRVGSLQSHTAIGQQNGQSKQHRLHSVEYPVCRLEGNHLVCSLRSSFRVAMLCARSVYQAQTYHQQHACCLVH